MTTVAEIVKELDRIAPPRLAEDGDAIGLQLGSAGQPVSRMAVTVDTSPRQIELALDARADLIVAHHPLIYTPLKAVVEDDPVGRAVAKLVRANVSLFVAHTNYDSAPGGVNDVLASTLGLNHATVLASRKQDQFFKIAVFVPEEALDRVRNAMAEAGAGVIGEYTHCSFRTPGTGSFLPSSEARPYTGQCGKLEETPEFRLEMLCSGSKRDGVIAGMIAAHPYEEVAYDIYPLANMPASYGFGRVGELDQPMPLEDFAEAVKSRLRARFLKVMGDEARTVQKVAVCGGGGSALYKDAAALGAHVYVTGDVKHHDALAADALGLAVIDAGHFETERPGVIALAERLKTTFAETQVELIYVE